MFKFLKMASTVSLCSALMMIAPSSEAALVNYNFNGVIDSGSLINETYTGSFAYDNAALSNSGAESIDLSSLSFNFLATVFTLADADALTNSTADFLNGDFLGVSYAVNSFEPTFSLTSASVDAAYFSYTPTSADSGFGSLTYTVSSVPVPAAVWMFGSALAGFGAINRRKRQITL